MPNIEFFDGKGNTSDAQGRPWVEVFDDNKVINRLMFETYLDHAGEFNDDTKAAEPLETVPQLPIRRVDTKDKGSLGEFFDRHKRRGPYRKT